MKTYQDRFHDSYVTEPNSGCWLWVRTSCPRGYGRIFVKDKQVLAHRVSWRIHKGEIPDGMFVCHRCDTPSCVNPAHLFLGTPADNMADKIRKGRHRTGFGSSVRNEKLLEADVLNIRESTEASKVLAERYGVRFNCIHRIKRGETWKHLIGQSTANAISGPGSNPGATLTRSRLTAGSASQRPTP